MSELSTKDWELVNAYHDGELAAEDARLLEMRLQAEPALASALESVSAVSGSLGALRPEFVKTSFVLTASTPDQSRRHPVRWMAGAALAASLAAAMFLGADLFKEPTLYDLHRDLAGESFSVDAADARLIASTGGAGAPDLGGANLTPVAFKVLEGGRVTHYSGRNGCRLSYFQGDPAFHDGTVPNNAQSATWTTSPDVRHTIVATGMDPNRFDAIAAYLKMTTKRQSSEEVVASLSEATTSSVPCVG